MPKPQTLGERIAQARREKAARDHRDIRQKDVAVAIGVSSATISEAESDKQPPGEGVLVRLADYLGVTPAYLRYGVAQPSETKADLAAMVDPSRDHRATEAELDRDERIAAGKKLVTKQVATKAAKRKTG